MTDLLVIAFFGILSAIGAVTFLYLQHEDIPGCKWGVHHKSH